MFSFLSDYQRILVLTIMFFGLMWILESFFLVRLTGNIKRGFKIWSRPLPNEAQEYLSNLTKNIIEPHRIGFQTVYSFIQVESNEVIVRQFHRTLIPFVAYVNLTKPNARLEYRGGVSHYFVFFLAFVNAFYFVIPLFALLLAINYWMEMRAIDNYLNKKIHTRCTV